MTKEAERDLKMLTLKIGVMQPEPRDASSHQKLKGARKDSILEPLEESWPCQLFDISPVVVSLDYWPPQLLQNTFLLF